MSENQQPAVSTADLVEAVKRATGEVFSTMLGLELEMKDAFVEKANVMVPASGVVSLIGLAGAFAGTGSLSCSSQFACRISGALLMSEHEKMDEEVLDSIAEITNMVIGNVKTTLEEKLGVSLGLSTPTVIFGLNFQTRGVRNQEWIVIPFSSGEDHLFVQLCLGPNSDENARPGRPGFNLPQVVSF
ncbi:MAG TPA: chemotaxis protein CheX [Bryobacteraceae bacterium]|nr:chemotaxis protein CheX [Bryobacteraceae bacterium]